MRVNKRRASARLTLNLYAQVMQRQRVDEALIWQLMRFPDEPETKGPGPTIETTNETTYAERAGSTHGSSQHSHTGRSV